MRTGLIFVLAMLGCNRATPPTPKVVAEPTEPVVEEFGTQWKPVPQFDLASAFTPPDHQVTKEKWHQFVNNTHPDGEIPAFVLWKDDPTVEKRLPYQHNEWEPMRRVESVGNAYAFVHIIIRPGYTFVKADYEVVLVKGGGVPPPADMDFDGKNTIGKLIPADPTTDPPTPERVVPFPIPLDSAEEYSLYANVWCLDPNGMLKGVHTASKRVELKLPGVSKQKTNP